MSGQRKKSIKLTMRKTKLAATALALNLVASIGIAHVFGAPVLAATPRGLSDAVSAAKEPPTLVWGNQISNPQAAILAIHGLGMHKGCYDEFGKLMASKGIPVYAIDVRGFGDWYLNGKDKLDLPMTLADIKGTLELMKARYPNASLFLLGESMGGAIALRATSVYPELLRGLISSVPSGDRFSGLGDDLHVGLHVLAGGFSGRFNVGEHVVEHATKDEQLRARWNSDPLSRSKFSPDELILFQGFMNQNNVTASKVKTTPVLILQGAQDKLVRPGGSFNVWDHLATPDRTFAASSNKEHLIFEYGQYSQDDINYVLNWINKQMAPLPSQTVSEDSATSNKKPNVPSKDELVANAPHLTEKNTDSIASSEIVSKVSARPDLPSLAYWVELMRDGKRYRCNNKISFKSGDEIRLHVTSSVDGYAYILMKQGSSGAHAVLFPEARTGRNNALSARKDYALPSGTWLKFDQKPGTEKLSLIFARTPLDPDTNKYLNNKQTVLVSADRSGAKDLCPTRMQISWDDPNPLIMPASQSDSDVALASNSSMVRVAQKSDSQTPIIAIDIDLEHTQ